MGDRRSKALEDGPGTSERLDLTTDHARHRPRSRVALTAAYWSIEHVHSTGPCLPLKLDDRLWSNGRVDGEDRARVHPEEDTIAVAKHDAAHVIVIGHADAHQVAASTKV